MGPGDEEHPPELLHLTVDEVLSLYATMLGIGDVDAVGYLRDLKLLESALARPQNAAHYEDADLARQAATLLWGMVRNHPSIDGNKRIAYVATVTFLNVKGYTIWASEDEKFDLMIGVAGQTDVDAVESWVRDRLGRRPEPSVG